MNQFKTASVFHPVALSEATGFMKTAEHDMTKQYLIVFRDADGCQVTIRLESEALDSLVKKLALGPTKGRS